MNRVGKYELIAEIGRGGMATALLAVSDGPAGFSKLVVLKRPRLDMTSDDDALLRMFLNEARIAARLTHPNIVQTYEVGLEDDEPFIAMEYLEGQPLNRVRRRLRDHARRNAVVLHAISQTLGALHYAHELSDYDGNPLGLVHRDATPHNVFVTYEGHIKLMDFGIAKVVDSDATQLGMLKGKVRYLAPEQINPGSIDRRADIFAIGITLWETLARRPLFQADNDAAALRELAARQITDLAEVAPQTPAPLLQIVRVALAIDREERFSTAREMQAALDTYLERHVARVTPREIAELMDDGFAKQRKQAAALVKQHLGSAQSGQRRSHAPLPVIATTTAPPASQSVSSTQLTSSAQPKGRGLTAVGAILAAAGVSGALTVYLVDREMHVQPEPSPAAVETSPASSPMARTRSAPVKSAVQLSVRAEPSTAQIFVNDALMGTGDFTGDVPRAVHRVRIEAPGFVGRMELVDMTKDRKLAVTLAPIPDSSPHTFPKRPPSPTERTEDNKTVPKSEQPPGAVDTVNPYR